MDVSALLTEFFSLQTIIFTVCIGFFIYIVRRALELAQPRLKITRWWNEVALPAAPVATGCLAAWLIPSYPYPELFARATGARVFFGFACGMAADLLYTKYKKAIEVMAEVKEEKAAAAVSVTTTTPATPPPPLK
jgi:hypothetical protein